MKILAMSGSLRAVSSNTNLLLALARVAPPDVRVTLYQGMAGLPHFNPDEESVRVPATALALRAEADAADAFVISSPEYAHGVPGSFKNALDWLVGVGLQRKPVGLLNASPRATVAQAALAEILTTMDGTLVPGACLIVPVSGRPWSDADIAADPELAGLLRAALAALRAASVS